MIRGMGTLINVVTVLIGGSVGLLVGSKLSKSLQEAVLTVLGLTTVVIGVQMALNSKNILVVLGSLLVGTVIGELLKIDEGIKRLGDAAEKKFAQGSAGQFSRGLVTASLLFCVGPMTIIGSIQDGLTGNYTLIATKAMLDGFASLMFAASMGIGVLFSAVTVLVVQGGLTLLAGSLSAVMTQAVIAELTGVGGVMMVSIGLGILEIKKIKTANMLPALIVAPIIVLVLQRLGGV